MKTKALYAATALMSFVIGAVSCYWIISPRHSESRRTPLNECGGCHNCSQMQDSALKPYEYEGLDPSFLAPCGRGGDEVKWYRFIADFDGDGLDDVALSSPDASGRYGEEFSLYLQQTNGLYRYAGWFGAYAMLNRIRVEHIDDGWGKTKIWSSHFSGSGNEFGLACEEIGRDGKLSSVCWLSFFLNEGIERNQITERVVEAVFSKPHTIPIRLEYSNSTNALGEAVWVLLDSYTPPKDESENPPAAVEE